MNSRTESSQAMNLLEEDEQIVEHGMYKGLPFWVVLRDDSYCAYIYNRTSLHRGLRAFQRYLVKKKSLQQE